MRLQTHFFSLSKNGYSEVYLLLNNQTWQTVDFDAEDVAELDVYLNEQVRLGTDASLVIEVIASGNY